VTRPLSIIVLVLVCIAATWYITRGYTKDEIRELEVKQAVRIALDSVENAGLREKAEAAHRYADSLRASIKYTPQKQLRASHEQEAIDTDVDAIQLYLDSVH